MTPRTNNLSSVAMETMNASEAAQFCEELVANTTAFMNGPRLEPDLDPIPDVIIPIICCLGILGNTANLVVLTRKQLNMTMDRMGKSAHVGLVALAASDLLFCVSGLVEIFLPHVNVCGGRCSDTQRMLVRYEWVRTVPINTFILSSTWLTVLMAVGRYVGICHPLHARGVINLLATRVAIFLIFLGSLLVTMPGLWKDWPGQQPCSPLQPASCDCHYYHNIRNPGWPRYELSYLIARFVISICLPLMILTFCNVCLIRALQRSYRMQRQYRATRVQDSGHRITPTLITIIILFTTLVTPSEVAQFVKSPLLALDLPSHIAVINVLNMLQAINFAINFVLYCVINVHFRQAMLQVFCCHGCRKEGPRDTITTELYSLRSPNNQVNTTFTVNLSDTEMDA